MVAPIRITFGAPTDSNNKLYELSPEDPYNRKVTVELSFIISWRIVNLENFVMMGGIQNIRKQIFDLVVSTFTAEFAKETPAVALLRMEEHNLTLRTILEKKVSGWGITVEESRIKAFGFSHPLNTAVISVSIAEQTALAVEKTASGEAKRIEKLAEANRIRVEKEGQAIARARELLLGADAVGLEKLAKVMDTPAGQLAQQLQVIKTALEKANYSLLSTDGGVLGSVAGIKEALDKMGGDKKK
jgi:regulator of protease activity HflC (stomatin/prohibitin superfamily)